MKNLFWVLPFLVLCSVLASSLFSSDFRWPQDNPRIDPVRVITSSPQDEVFGDVFYLSPLLKHSVILANVGDRVSTVDLEIHWPASQPRLICLSGRFAQAVAGSYEELEEIQGTDLVRKIHLQLPTRIAKEFYAANVVVRFCGWSYPEGLIRELHLGPDYSKQSYFLGFGYWPAGVFAERAAGIGALTVGQLKDNFLR